MKKFYWNVFYTRTTRSEPFCSTMPPHYILPRGHGLFQITDQPDVINQAIRLRPIEGTIPSSETSFKANVRLDKPIFKQLGGSPGSPDCDPETCRELDLENPDDIRWFLNKLYKDVENASMEDLEELEDEETTDVIKGVDVIEHDPLILHYDPENMTYPPSDGRVVRFVGYVDGEHAHFLMVGYYNALVSLKRDGKPLPKPHPDAYYGLGQLSHDVSKKSSPSKKSGSEDSDGFFWNFTDFQTDFFELNNGALYVYGMGVLFLISLLIWFFMSRKRTTVTSNKNGADM